MATKKLAPAKKPVAKKKAVVKPTRPKTVKVLGWPVRIVKAKKKAEDRFIFGCGSVNLSRAEVEAYYKIRSADLTVYNEVVMSIEYGSGGTHTRVSLNEIQRVLAL